MPPALRLAAALLLALTGTLGGCARPEPAAGPTVATPNGEGITVTLSNFAFTPDRLILRAGRSVRLRLANVAGGSHDFSAPALFATSRIDAGAAAIRGGTIEVASHALVAVTLTPLRPGRYDVVCTHPLHELFGMTGSVQVLPAAP